MKQAYITIEKDADAFYSYQAKWAKRSITGERVDTMTEAIIRAMEVERSRVEQLYFISIVADDVNFLPQLDILVEVTAAPILIATSPEHYTRKEHLASLAAGADFYAQYCGDSDDDIDGVIAAIRSVEKRGKKEISPTSVVADGKILMSLSSRQAFVHDKNAELTHMEFDLLHHFMKNRGRAITYEELFYNVWEKGKADKCEFGETFNQSIRDTVNRLRKKLKADNTSDVIKTVRESGYMMP